MKVLIVASGNANYLSPFVADQMEALKKQGLEIDYFLIKGKGITGYLKNYRDLLGVISKFNPNIVHAHYGLSGLLANLQRKKPVVTTFHGCDVNVPSLRFFSKIADKLSVKSIFISQYLADKMSKKNATVIPCGVDFNVFFPMKKNEVRSTLGLDLEKKYILFSSSFSTPVKNYPLAKEAISKIGDENLITLELKGYTRQEVAMLMNAVDLVLLTSLREGSPQFIKEAMSCNTPIVSVDVGDVRDVIYKTDGCYIAESTADDLANKIKKALSFKGKTIGREKIKNFDNNSIASKIINIYNSIL